MFQILPVLCQHGQGGGGGVGGGGGQPNVDRPGQGEGVQKFPNLCGHPLWMTL